MTNISRHAGASHAHLVRDHLLRHVLREVGHVVSCDSADFSLGVLLHHAATTSRDTATAAQHRILSSALPGSCAEDIENAMLRTQCSPDL
jgi:hypothetical protein